MIKGTDVRNHPNHSIDLDVAQRLELFIPVCNAIQHAHQKGIIHRDIKPPKVLVTLQDGRPVPKVIDFGIAKATQQELTGMAVYTQFGHLTGTPECDFGGQRRHVAPATKISHRRSLKP